MEKTIETYSKRLNNVVEELQKTEVNTIEFLSEMVSECEGYEELQKRMIRLMNKFLNSKKLNIPTSILQDIIKDMNK